MTCITACGLAVLLLASSAPAQEPPHLDFVRRLREQGHYDLAAEYLESLSKRQISPELAALLPLEKGKTRCELAQVEPDIDRCRALYHKACEDIQSFLDADDSSPRAPEALLAIAKAKSSLGCLALEEAQVTERPAVRKPLLAQARAHFDDTGKYCGRAAKLIESKLERGGLEEAEIASLTDVRRSAELAQAVTQLHAYISTDDVMVTARPEGTQQCRRTLQHLADDGKNGAFAWLARAWLGRLYLETHDLPSAKHELQAVINERHPAAGEARRLARHFRLLMLDRDNETRDSPAIKHREAEQWLKDYPSHAKTAEGLRVRFHLAEACLALAKKKPSDARRLTDQAEKIYEALYKANTLFSRQARERRLALVYAQWAERSKGDINTVADFDECWLRAQVEIHQLNQESPEPLQGQAPEGPKKTRDERVRDLGQTLHRALELAGPAPADEVFEAQSTLAYLCLTELADPHRAAILGEDLARRHPTSPRASTAAAYALEAYHQIAAGLEKQGAPAPTADLARLARLAEFMEATWPADSATDYARFHLGLLALRGKRYPEAIEKLGRIAPTFPLFAVSQMRLAAAARTAHQEGLAVPPGAPSYMDQSILALQRIPYPGNAEYQPLALYFQAKRDLAQMLVSAERFGELAVLSDRLSNEFAAAKPGLNETLAKEMEPAFQLLPVYAQFGQAQVHVRARRHQEAARLLNPIIARLQEESLKTTADPRFVSMVRGLALWANIQAGRQPEAKEILRSLMEQPSDEVGDTGVFGDLLARMRAQLDEIRSRSGTDSPEFRAAVHPFAQLLDDIALEPQARQSRSAIRFLAHSYSILGRHGQAADLLDAIANPGGNNPEHQSLRVLQVRELRLARRLDEAREKLRHILKTDAGRKSLDANKELASLWEDREDYAAAMRAWSDLMNAVRPQMDRNPRLQDLYYECYFHVVLCMCRSADKMTDPAKKREEYRKAGHWYLKLRQLKEDMGGPELTKRYLDLQARHPAFKAACQNDGNPR
jgi:hypothetical protein